MFRLYFTNFWYTILNIRSYVQEIPDVNMDITFIFKLLIFMLILDIPSNTA